MTRTGRSSVSLSSAWALSMPLRRQKGSSASATLKFGLSSSIGVQSVAEISKRLLARLSGSPFGKRDPAVFLKMVYSRSEVGRINRRRLAPTREIT